MTLTLRPRGRGNWRKVVLVVDDTRHWPLPLEVHVGELLTIGSRVFRIVGVTG